jgi:CheY-like chemotaxis protein
MPGADGLATAHLVMDASSDLMAIKDLHGRFVAANWAFRAAAAASAEALGTMTNRDLFDEDAARMLTASEHLAVLAEAPIACDVPVAWHGQPQVFKALVAPWLDGSTCQGVLVAGRLASARSAPVQSLASHLDELAHRFNNALTTVVGLADWHLVMGEVAGGVRDDLEKIRAAATAAEQTARDIQRLARGAAADLAGAPERATPDAQADPAAPHGPRILLVDDQPEVRGSLSVMIRTLGYDVHAVEGGAAAIAWLARESADLVLTDLTMPGMTGAELAAAIGQTAPGVPVAVMTGWAGAQPAVPAGVARVLPKPLRMAQLREALSALVGPPAAH